MRVVRSKDSVVTIARHQRRFFAHSCDSIARRAGAVLLCLLTAPLLLGAAADDAAEETDGRETEVSAATPPTDPQPSEPRKSELFERVRVVGTPEQSATIPGSVSYISEERLARQDYSDVHRVLSVVPGVNVQEEEGYGLRPNIGLRGTGAERSSKITLMEDGVLIAPAPYSAPSAYYFPTMGRMDGLEVRKGSASVQQGPFTNGGVLNLLSSAIPSSFGGQLNVAVGDDDLFRGRVRLGDSGERFGWLVESYQLDTDGFKDLDGGGSTGVRLEDYLVKLRFNSAPSSRTFQALEVKLGKTDQVGHETYLGLTDEDFDRTPYRRYSASQEDILDSEHEQVHLRYMVRPSDKVDVTATLYRNDFFRNWRKLGKVDAGAGMVGIGDVLDDPTTYANELAILRGDANSGDDALNVRNNRRDYYAQGLHGIVAIHPGGNDSTHELEVGFRYHEDEEDRFQEEDLFRMVDGRMSLTTTGSPASQANRINSAEALAFHAQDTITAGAFTIVPGVRFEHIDFERRDYGKLDPARSGADLEVRDTSVDEWIPGVGVTYELNPSSRLFAGVHRGFAPPGPGSDRETDPEESVNYELGYRHRGDVLGFELVGFYNDYDNLLGADTLSSGGSGEGDLFNGGEVVSRGLEASINHDLAAGHDLPVSLPLSFAYTYTDAEFRSSFSSGFDAWGDVESGDGLPYVPEHQASLETGVVQARWSTFANFTYQDETRTVAGQGPIPDRESTDSRLLVDLSVDYRVRPELRLFVQIRNLTDEDYVAARRPAGARPGLPRTALVGVGFDF
jgi:Fe(3+) dicitrate transport protein